MVFTFEDLSEYDDCTEQRDICNTNTPITATSLNGTIEANFCRVFSDLCEKTIDRHDPNLFGRKLESKQKVFYISPTIGYNKCELYPLRTGLFITPKPLRFVPISKIKYYEYSRKEQSLRYYDIAIVLYSEESEENGEDQNNKNKKKRKNANRIDLTMIDKRECNELVQYFMRMRITEKKEGMTSPDRKKQSEKNEMEDNDEDAAMDDDLSDDDEEYKMEDDEYDYSGSEEDDDDDEEDEDEDEDIDMTEIDDAIKNCQSVENGQNLSENMKINRKRKRNEANLDDDDASNEENVSSKDNTNNSSPRKKVRRVNIHRNIHRNIVRGSSAAIGTGRKSTGYGDKGANIVSKTVNKKKSIMREQNKKEEEEGDLTEDDDEVQIIKVRSPKKSEEVKITKIKSPKRNKKKATKSPNGKRSKSKDKKKKKKSKKNKKGEVNEEKDGENKHNQSTIMSFFQKS